MTIFAHIRLSTTIAKPMARGATGPANIEIAEGTGYAGSRYRATDAGLATEWFADGQMIAMGQDYVLQVEHEGKAIRAGSALGPTSNTIEMWMPTDLPSEMRANGGWWDPKRSMTVVDGAVSQLTDQFGVRNYTQVTVASRPSGATIDGYPSVNWPLTANRLFLDVAAAFSPVYALFVATYNDGARATFIQRVAFMSAGANSPLGIRDRLYGEENTNRLRQLADSNFAITARINDAAENAIVLPLPKSVIEFAGSGNQAYRWGLGRTHGDNTVQRSWQGPMFDVLMLGQEPSGDVRDRIIGCFAHRNGIAAKLPDGHPYKTAGPRLQ